MRRGWWGTHPVSPRISWDTLARPELRPLRKLAFTVAAVLLAGLGVVAPAAAPAASAATGPKVAIIVGATHSATAQYRSYADQVYAEAIRYTPNVVKVYSPNATWTKVKAAVNGASIIVYLGHGNGWPSPYTYDPNYTTKDGFGLNYDVNGDGKLSDYENKYYGEPSIRTLTPAPNAVVLLFHLCYASGNSEPGGKEPSVSVAMQRADNYASAFLRTGARAVVAIGHSHSAYYISGLFTTRQTIESYFRNAPDFNDNVLSFDSTRSPGYSIRLDPDSASPSGFYRSITGKMSLTTEQVTGASYATTAGDPDTFAIPGNASPVTDGAPLYADANAAVAGGSPTARLSTTDKVRIDAQEAAKAADGSPILLVHVDDGGKGWMTGSSLVPRDSVAPQLWTIDDGTGTFSPNGDGRLDAFPLVLRISETASWTLKILDGSGAALASVNGKSDTPAITWSPAAGSVPDGTYTWTFRAVDGWGNGPLVKTGPIVVDTLPPADSIPGTAGATYVPLAPVRLLDTRPGGTGLAGPFTSGTARTFQVTGRGKVPAGAIAVTGNLTVTGQTSSGYVALTPDPVNSPTTSTLNVPRGDTRANGVTVRLSAKGTLSATFKGAAGATTALVFDVTGYFLPGTAGATYVPLAPVRLLDTRPGGTGLAGPFTSGTARTFQVTGRGKVPAGAIAVTGNLTVTGQTSSGYVALTPDPVNSPTTSTLNVPRGDTRANGVTVRLSAKGTLSATFKGAAGATTALVFDVTGYFLPGTAGATYVPLAPVRLLDTRPGGTGLAGPFTSGTARTFQVTGRGKVPAGAIAVTGNLTVTGQTSSGYVALTPDPVNSPTTSTLNVPRGDTRANGVTVRLSAKGTLSATFKGAAGATTALVFDVTGYFLP